MPEFARRAGLDPTTVRAIVNGTRWPRDSTRAKLRTALGWPNGEITRVAIRATPALSAVSTADLVRELCNRLNGHEPPD